MGSIAKWRKATISFVISDCLSFLLSAWDNSAPTGRIFMKSDVIFRKSIEKIQVSLKSDKNKQYSTGRPIYMIDDSSLSSS